MDFITGEKIQFICDHFIGSNEDFRFNPDILQNHKNKCIFIDKFHSNLNNNYRIFCYTHMLDNIEFLILKLKLLLNPFILIFHNSDKNFDKEYLILFDRLYKLKHIYTQNMNIIHNKVTPIPIGLPNSQWIHGNLHIFNEIYNNKKSNNNLIYFNFKINTNKQKRRECFQILNNKNLKWNSDKDYKNYLISLHSYKYCICPEGNGIDTHRLWECLYLNVIPICLKNTLTLYYSKYFPIILLDNWKDFDVNILNSNYSNIKIDTDLLHMKYIEMLFSNKF